jgi:hypothetical protein
MKRWTGDWAIPKTIHLPGVTVQVQVIGEKDDRALLRGCDGFTMYSYHQDACRIILDGTLPLPVQRYVLIHELRHVDNELQDIMLEHFPKYVQTKHMAGL